MRVLISVNLTGNAWMLRRRMLIGTAGLILGGCASTTSTLVSSGLEAPRVAVLSLEGPLGAQAADLISQELAANGIATVERARMVQFQALDTDLDPSSPAAVQTLASLGATLGVNFLFVGTISTDAGPLASFAHVFMTLRLIDIRSGQTRWIGRYGNSLWTSAFSTQGDLQRGARDIVREFIKEDGPSILNG